MSDSDDDFLLPDNSGKQGKSSGSAKHPATFSATPTPVSMDPTPIGFPGGTNADYASGLLAARRRNLSQQPRSGGQSPSMGRTTSPTTATNSAMPHFSGSMVPPVSPLVPPAQSPAPASTPTQQPPLSASTYSAEDDALMKILNPTPFVAQGRRAAAPDPQNSPQASHASVTPSVGVPPAAPAAVVAAAPPNVVDAARIEQLRAELDAKKRTLAQLREKEDAFSERVRADKASKLAALQSAEAQVKKQWDELEREKDRMDTELRREEEAQEAFLRKERHRIEEEETAKHMPRLEALRTKHRVLQEEEAALRQTLQAAGANKDLVTTAIGNAVTEILKKVKELFAQSDQQHPGTAGRPPTSPGDASSSAAPMSDLKEWEASVRSMVRSEIRTAFVSSVSGAAETERSEFAKSFEEMLRFWKEAEEEERHHVTRMDEQLLLDLQSMAHEDLDRLQREENALEEMFLQSREQWTLHHQKMLHDELDAVMARRSKELDAQRAMRNELHQRRLRGIEEAHAQRMEHEKAVHAKKLELIRSEQQMLERVHEAKLDMVKRVREDANCAMEGITGAVDMLSTTLTRMRELQRALEEMRGALDRDRQKSLELREETLSHVQGLIVAQATAVEHERTVLGTALVKLDVTQAAVDRQLEQERNWVAETQAKLERSRGEWEREYRRWQHTTAQEKRNAEQRFSDVLLQLGDANSQLEQESRDLEIEGNAMRRACAERSAAVSAEMVAVEKKEEELSDKHQRLLLLLADLEAKSRDLSSEWQQTLLRRQELATQRGELEREEMKLAQMTEQLDFMKRQVDNTNYETREAALRGRSFETQLEASREAARDGLERVRRHAEQTLSERQQQQGRNQENTATTAMKPQVRGMSNPDRLPLRVLAELRDSLAPVASQSRRVPHQHHHQDPAASAPSARRQPQRSSNDDADEDGDELTHTAGAASSYHFTNLVGVSDAESTAVSQQTSS